MRLAAAERVRFGSVWVDVVRFDVCGKILAAETWKFVIGTFIVYT